MPDHPFMYVRNRDGTVVHFATCPRKGEHWHEWNWAEGLSPYLMHDKEYVPWVRPCSYCLPATEFSKEHTG